MRELHKNYGLLIVFVSVFLFCVLGLVSFAKSSGSSARFFVQNALLKHTRKPAQQ